MPVISLIVPVYNVAEFLPACIESVLAQTFRDFELILIDDGSTDNSLQVLREYEKKDARIRVIEQENAGVSAARNAGLDAARGDYIGFVDSDDEILPEMLSDMIAASTEHDADVVCCAFGRIVGEEKHIQRTSDECAVYSGMEIIQWFFNTTFGNLCWNKIYRRSLVESIRFPVGRAYAEDIAFTFRALLPAGKAVFLNKDLYLYRKREGSAMHQKYNVKKMQQQIGTYREIYLSAREKYPLLKSLAKKEYLTVVYRCLGEYSLHMENAKDELYLSYFNEIRKNWFFMIRNAGFSWKEKTAFFKILLGSRAYLKLTKIKV